jgi:hypothetical protein
LVKDDFAPDKVVQDGSLTKSDVIGFNARTNLNLVFNNKRIKNLSNEQFVKLTTIFLGLPPSQDRGNAEIVPGVDYPVESCMTVHGRNITPYLDANGDHHAGSCPSAAASVSQRHSALSKVISMFALEAGAYPTREPPPPTNYFKGFSLLGSVPHFSRSQHPLLTRHKQKKLWISFPRPLSMKIRLLISVANYPTWILPILRH